jgi:hypothetical protein
MIVFCEPLIKGFGHEKVNSGFLTAYNKAFKGEPIMVFAHKTHIKAIDNILENDNIKLNDVHFNEINFNTSNQFVSFITHFLLLFKVIRYANKIGQNKIFFLSVNSQMLYLLKFFQWIYGNRKLEYSIVMHGFLEDILAKPDVISVTNIYGLDFLLFSIRNIHRPFYVFDKLFSVKRFFEKSTNDKFKFILLSHHILIELRKHIDISSLNIQVLDMPTNFHPRETDENSNKFIKFAMFGRGDYKMLIRLAEVLNLHNINNQYEIRIIGKDYVGLETFDRITCSSPGVKLSRQEMELQVKDIDMFLILYDEDKYKLSCSASIFEAMSYLKPIVYLSNECINYYDKSELKIGYKCDSIDEFAKKVVFLIDNYIYVRNELSSFKNNLYQLRQMLSIDNNIQKFKNSL